MEIADKAEKEGGFLGETDRYYSFQLSSISLNYYAPPKVASEREKVWSITLPVPLNERDAKTVTDLVLQG